MTLFFCGEHTAQLGSSANSILPVLMVGTYRLNTHMARHPWQYNYSNTPTATHLWHLLDKFREGNKVPDREGKTTVTNSPTGHQNIGLIWQWLIHTKGDILFEFQDGGTLWDPTHTYQVLIPIHHKTVCHCPPLAMWLCALRWVMTFPSDPSLCLWRNRPECLRWRWAWAWSTWLYFSNSSTWETGM